MRITRLARDGVGARRLGSLLSEPGRPHITFGTYGTRRHGDPRGTVSRAQNQLGDPIVGTDDDWQHDESAKLTHPPVRLSREQRIVAQHAVERIERPGGRFTPSPHRSTTCTRS